MDKFILRSLIRSSAKQKPELEHTYVQSVINSNVVYLTVLEPITADSGEITDFRILIASKSIKQLEDDQDMEGKSISEVYPSFEQWMIRGKSAMSSNEVITHNVSYLTANGTSIFKVFLSRMEDLLIANWLPIQVSNEKHLELSNQQKESERTMQVDEPVADEKEIAATQTIRTIIHEIRNPLTAIALANQLLMDSSNNGGEGGEISMSSLTSIIYENSRKIEEHLRQLLLPKASEETAFARTELCRLVGEALQRAESRLFLGRVKVCRNFQPGFFIRGNEDKLITAFLNLIINAIEAMSPNNAHLWISIYPVDKYIKVVIRDNGSGIEPEILARIFEANFSKKQSGLGLGLANVKEIIEQHNAIISVSSELGKGTSFSILFPQVNSPIKTNKNSSQYRMDF